MSSCGLHLAILTNKYFQMKRKHLFLIIFLLPVLFSCQSSIRFAYGIKKTKVINENLTINYRKKHHLPNIYTLDSAYIVYLDTLKSKIDTPISDNEDIIHDLQQPIQLFCFNSDGDLIAYATNCAAGGFPNLGWNKQHNFDQFPPKTLSPVNSWVKFSAIRHWIHPVTDQENIENPDYNIILFCNYFIERQSVRLIKNLKRSLKFANGKTVKVCYVNNDRFFLNQ